MKHYHKINIFGDFGVGKSSLIQHMEYFEDGYFYLKKRDLGESEIALDSIYSNFIVEEIKSVKIPINDENDFYLNLYETNLDNYDSIKMNLDTLLLHSECIIIMWDYSDYDTFDNIPNLFNIIIEGINDKKFRNAQIFLLQNKIDLNIEANQINAEKEKYIKDSLEKMKKLNKNVNIRKISLLEKDYFYGLLLEIYRKLSYEQHLFNEEVVNLVKFNFPTTYKNINKDNIIKCITFGHTSAEMNKIIDYFQRKNYYHSQISTIGLDVLNIEFSINLEKTNKTDKIKYYLQIYTQTGQERYRSIPKNLYKNSNVILFFYDVTNQESFKSLKEWISDIKDDEGDIPLILLANKIHKFEKRVITKRDGILLANEYNMKYYECSSKYGLNLYEILSEIIYLGYNNHIKKETQLNQANKSIKLSKHRPNNAKSCISFKNNKPYSFEAGIPNNSENNGKNQNDNLKGVEKNTNLDYLEELNLLIVVNIESSDENIFYSTICKNTENFSRIENTLYIKYPQYCKKNNIFICNGNIIDKQKSLEQNKIKDNDLITILI